MHDLESLMTTELSSQMQEMFRALCHANDGERSNAADAWHQFLVDNRLHPDDLRVVMVGTAEIERNQVIAELTEQVTRLGRENAYLRQQVPANALHDATAAGEIDPTPWTELYERLVAAWGDPLPANWRSRLARLTETSLRIVKRWEIGLVEVPAEAIVKVPEQEVLVLEPSGRSRQHTARRRRVTPTQLDILKALDGRELTVRQLSFQLYEEPDTNENLADAVSNLVGRNWLSRQHVAQPTERRTKWAYTLAKEGRQVMEEAREQQEAADQVVADQAAKEKGSG